MAGITLGMKAVAAGGEDAADQIARLLREGRAAEVTDEMLGALGPNDQAKLFDLYESGATGMPMPMDEASRMARAREVGFNMTEAAPMASGPIEGGGGPSVAKPPQLFHGASEDFAAFSPDRYGTGAGDWSGKGIYTTPDALEAEGYGEFVMPLHSRAGSVETQYLRDYNWRAPENFAEYLKSQGFDALNMRVRDVDDRTGVVDADWLKERVDFDPANIRSRHARFDPRLSKNADLLASRAPVPGAGGVMATRPTSPAEPSGDGPSLSDVLGRLKQAFGLAGRAGIEGMATALSGVDEQGRSVGSILPFAKDERTGEVGLASPRILDLWNTAGGAVPAKGITLGAGPVMRAAAKEGVADQIARLLREGRAAEVTDEMLGALTPNDQARLFELYESGATGMDLPMDEASRMARAREMGFDTEAFHASRASEQFPRFDGGSRGSVYFAATPGRAETGAAGGAQDLAHLSAAPTERASQSIMPMRLRGDDVRTLRPSREKWSALPEVADGDQVSELAESVGGNYWWDVYDERQVRAPKWDDNDNLIDAGEFEYTKLPYPEQRYTGRSQAWQESGRQLPGYNVGDDVQAVERSRSGGQKGFLVSDEAGASIVMAPDAPIRSRHARFDPRLSKNADLLASRAAPGSLGIGGDRRLTYRDVEDWL